MATGRQSSTSNDRLKQQINVKILAIKMLRAKILCLLLKYSESIYFLSALRTAAVGGNASVTLYRH